MSQILIGGNFRGGTSMLARIVEAAGVPFPGPFHTEKNRENREWQLVLHPAHTSGRANLRSIKKLADKFDARFAGHWAMKYPAVHVFAYNDPDFLQQFTDPLMLLIARRPADVYASEVRNGYRGKKFPILHRAKHYNYLTRELYHDQPCPVFTANYGDFLGDPVRACRKVSEFIGQGDPVEMAKLIDLGGGRSSESVYI